MYSGHAVSSDGGMQYNTPSLFGTPICASLGERENSPYSCYGWSGHGQPHSKAFKRTDGAVSSARRAKKRQNGVGGEVSLGQSRVR